MSVATIRTARLDLVSMSPAFIDALLACRRADAEAEARLRLPDGCPDEHDSRFLGLRLEQMRKDPQSQVWLVWAMVLRSLERPMVGHIGFHGPPQQVRRAELGYTVLPDFRRERYASEAAEGLMAWARREHGVERFFLAIAPSNRASLAMAVKLGFTQVGEQMDEEDGLEYVFERLGA